MEVQHIKYHSGVNGYMCSASIVWGLRDATPESLYNALIQCRGRRGILFVGHSQISAKKAIQGLPKYSLSMHGARVKTRRTRVGIGNTYMYVIKLVFPHTYYSF